MKFLVLHVPESCKLTRNELETVAQGIARLIIVKRDKRRYDCVQCLQRLAAFQAKFVRNKKENK